MKQSLGNCKLGKSIIKNGLGFGWIALLSLCPVLPYLHGDGRGDDLVLDQVPEPVERGQVELERQVLRPQLQEGLRGARDLLAEAHAGLRGAVVLNEVGVARSLGREAQLEAPRVRRLQGALGPPLRPHRELALKEWNSRGREEVRAGSRRGTSLGSVAKGTNNEILHTVFYRRTDAAVNATNDQSNRSAHKLIKNGGKRSYERSTDRQPHLALYNIRVCLLCILSVVHTYIHTHVRTLLDGPDCDRFVETTYGSIVQLTGVYWTDNLK